MNYWHKGRYTLLDGILLGAQKVGCGNVVATLGAYAMHRDIDVLTTYHTALGKQKRAYGSICINKHRHLHQSLRP